MPYPFITRIKQMKNILHTAIRRAAAGRLVLFAFGVVTLCVIAFAAPARMQAQTVSHPVSEITTVAKHYSYAHMISSTEKKDLEYIIVRASDGEIKTVFDACDVCYLAYKGYSQSGSDLRCNNCGNRFAIDTLGGRNTAGTCHPGYLPHRIEGDQVVIEVADLIVGAYYFKLQTVTGLGDSPGVADALSIRQNGRELTVTLQMDASRSYHIFSIDGQLLRTLTDASRIVRIPLEGFIPGAYVLAIEEAKQMTSKVFLVD